MLQFLKLYFDMLLWTFSENTTINQIVRKVFCNKTKVSLKCDMKSHFFSLCDRYLGVELTSPQPSARQGDRPAIRTRQKTRLTHRQDECYCDLLYWAAHTNCQFEIRPCVQHMNPATIINTNSHCTFSLDWGNCQNEDIDAGKVRMHPIQAVHRLQYAKCRAIGEYDDSKQ